MHVITQRALRQAWEVYPDTETALRNWITSMRNMRFANFTELRKRWPSADQVGRLTVFNIKGNNYRLIVRIDYANGKVFIRDFLTHANYDKNEQKNDAWF